MRNAKLRSGASGASGASTGAGLKTVLINDQVGSPNKWEHKIRAEDLAGGGEIAFILAIADEDMEYSVCIPTIQELPELEGVKELKFYIYSGFGLANFSTRFNGVELGSGMLGRSGIRGGGCLIARRHDLGNDTWLVTQETFNQEGPVVLKDWKSSTERSINLLSGFDLENEGSLTVEIRNLKILSGELNVFLRMSKAGGDIAGLEEQSFISGVTTYNNINTANLFELSFKPVPRIIGNDIGKTFFKINSAVIDILKPVSIDGVAYSFIDAEVVGAGGYASFQNTGGFRNNYVYKVKSNDGVVANELNLVFDGGVGGLSYEYRVIKKQ